MITQQITAIALRLFSIWLLVQLVLNLPSLFMLLTSIEQYRQQEISFPVYAAITVSFILIGLLSAFFLNKAASSVLSKSKNESETSLGNDSQKLLFQLAGLYFVVTAIVYLPRSLAIIPNTTEITLQNMLWPAGLVFQLAIGIWLATSSGFWVHIFQKLRGRA